MSSGYNLLSYKKYVTSEYHYNDTNYDLYYHLYLLLLLLVLKLIIVKYIWNEIVNFLTESETVTAYKLLIKNITLFCLYDPQISLNMFQCTGFNAQVTLSFDKLI